MQFIRKTPEVWTDDDDDNNWFSVQPLLNDIWWLIDWSVSYTDSSKRNLYFLSLSLWSVILLVGYSIACLVGWLIVGLIDWFLCWIDAVERLRRAASGSSDLLDGTVQLWRSSHGRQRSASSSLTAFHLLHAADCRRRHLHVCLLLLCLSVSLISA